LAEAIPPPPPAPSFPTHPPQDEAEEPARQPGTFDRAPPRGLIIGVAAGLGLLLLIGGGLVTWRKLGRRPPPAVAVEALASAQADADKDTVASIASAESKARDAVDAAGARARFAEGTALLARIEIQWADALNDQVAQIADKGGDESRTAQLQAQAKAKLKSAFDLLSPALKANKESPDLQLAFADYYRAQRLPSSMNRYLANVKDDPRAALIQAMALAPDEEGAAKAIPLLKAALAANPQSARIQYRLAVAQLAAKDEAAARAALNEALRLSPQHERAKTLLEQLPQASTGAPK
jgi:tetratricopeptide (TPR) repeat protein